MAELKATDLVNFKGNPLTCRYLKVLFLFFPGTECGGKIA